MIIGIDPGKYGAATVIGDNGEIVLTVSYSKFTPHDIAMTLRTCTQRVTTVKAYLEKTGPRELNGKIALYSSGENSGFWRGILTALNIPFDYVTPLMWQRTLGCNKKRKSTTYREHKNNLKAKAQELYPNNSISLETADSILIAEYGRRLQHG